MEFRTETGFLSTFAHRGLPVRTSGECWECYSSFRYDANGWAESQTQVAGAFSQAPHLPREPHAMTIRVAHGLSAVLCLSFVRVSFTTRFHHLAACLTGFLGRDGSLYAASEQLPIYGADNRAQISRLPEIIINFDTDAMNCGFKSGVRRQEDCHGIWIGFPHGLYNCESVAFPVNIDVRQQNIKALSFYRCERLRYICRDLHLKSALLENRQQRQTTFSAAAPMFGPT